MKGILDFSMIWHKEAHSRQQASLKSVTESIDDAHRQLLILQVSATSIPSGKIVGCTCPRNGVRIFTVMLELVSAETVNWKGVFSFFR